MTTHDQRCRSADAIAVLASGNELAHSASSRFLHRDALGLRALTQRFLLAVGQAQSHSHGSMVSVRYRSDLPLGPTWDARRDVRAVLGRPRNEHRRRRRSIVALTAGDLLVVEPGESHTFTASSDHYRHFVVQAPFVSGDKRSA